MSDSLISVVMCCGFAIILILTGLFVGIRSMEKEREELLKRPFEKYEKNVPWYLKTRRAILGFHLWMRITVSLLVIALYFGLLWHFDLPFNHRSNVGMRTGLKNGPVWKRLSAYGSQEVVVTEIIKTEK